MIRLGMLALTITCLIALVSAQKTTGQAGNNSPETSPFFTVRPGPRVRRRLCPDSVVLYLGKAGTPRTRLALQARGLADVLHRPVTAFAWSREGKVGKGEAQVETLTQWLEQEVRNKTSFHVIGYGTGNSLAQKALSRSTLVKERVLLLAFDSPEAISLPSARTWRIHGDKAKLIVLDPGAPSESAKKPARKTAEIPFAEYLGKVRRHVYGKTLDAVLRCKEKIRYPRRTQIFEFRRLADDSYTGRSGLPMRDRFDMAGERRRLDKWLDKPANLRRIERDPQAIALFNRLPAEKGGPKNWYLDWYPMHRTETEAWRQDPKAAEKKGLDRWVHEPHRESHRHFMAINMHEEAFLAEDVDTGSLRLTADATGRPALDYRIIQRRTKAYGDMTERGSQHFSAFMIQGYVRLAPIIMGRIPGNGFISGAFTRDEIKKLIKTMKSALPPK